MQLIVSEFSSIAFTLISIIMIQQNMIQTLFLPFILILFCSPIYSIQHKCRDDSETASPSQKDSAQDTYLRRAFNYSQNINETSEYSTQCLGNSICTENGYCMCEKGYILGCETPSHSLTFTNESFEIENEEKLFFDIAPLRLNQYLMFKLNFCEFIPKNSDEGNSKTDIVDEEQSFVYDLRMYADLGVMDQIDDRFQVMNASLPSYDRYCWKILTPIIKFGKKKNGDNQQLILSIKRINKEKFLQTLNSTSRNLQQLHAQAEQKLEISSNVRTIQLSVMQLIVYNPNQNNFATFVMITLLLLSSLITCITFLLLWLQYRRYGGRFFNNRRVIPNDLSHFQNYIPKYKSDQNTKEVQNQDSCSICFLEFQPGCQLRQTLCCHVFHAECLEKWCVNNLTCPVCRGCLKKCTMKKILKEKRRLRRINEMINNGTDKEEIERKKMEMIEDELLERDNFSGIEECDDPLQSEFRRKKKGVLGRWVRRRRDGKKKDSQKVDVSEPSSMREVEPAQNMKPESI